MKVCRVSRMTAIDSRKTADILNRPLKKANARAHPDKQAKPKRNRTLPKVKSAESKIKNPKDNNRKLMPMQTRPIFVWSLNMESGSVVTRRCRSVAVVVILVFEAPET